MGYGPCCRINIVSRKIIKDLFVLFIKFKYKKNIKY